MSYGILNLYKPIGPTSRDCVNRLLPRFRPSKVAHAGTLDPLAQGVLLILVGPAVRLMDEIHELDKEYVATFVLGQRSPSGDLETPSESVPLPSAIDRHSIQQAMGSFVGCIEQIPPAYSAVWVDGKRSHQAARRGESLSIPARKVTVHELELLDSDLPILRLRIQCSTGTYVRTLGSDLAKSLGSDAVMTELIRVRVGSFHLQAAQAIDALPDSISNEMLQPAIAALSQWERWRVDDSLMRRILDGQRLSPSEIPSKSGSRLAVLDEHDILRALLKKLPDGTWRCDKGIAHWDVYPST